MVRETFRNNGVVSHTIFIPKTLETNDVSKFIEEIRKRVDTYAKKNHDYGNSFSESCDKLGLVAAVTRMYDKMNRIITLSQSNAAVNDESIADTLGDLANYAIMTKIWLENKK